LRARPLVGQRTITPLTEIAALRFWLLRRIHRHLCSAAQVSRWIPSIAVRRTGHPRMREKTSFFPDAAMPTCPTTQEEGRVPVRAPGAAPPACPARRIPRPPSPGRIRSECALYKSRGFSSPPANSCRRLRRPVPAFHSRREIQGRPDVVPRRRGVEEKGQRFTHRRAGVVLILRGAMSLECFARSGR